MKLSPVALALILVASAALVGSACGRESRTALPKTRALGPLPALAPADVGRPMRDGLITFSKESGPSGLTVESVWAVRADGSRARELTFGAEARWSPDGTHVAYSSGTGHIEVEGSRGYEGRIFMCPLYGPAVCDDFRWLPDGKHLAIDVWCANPPCRNPAAGTYLVNADGSGRRRIFDESVKEPEWSPDGRKIAFISGAGGIVVMNYDGSREKRITSPQLGRSFDLRWSPDSRWLLFGRAPLGQEPDGCGRHGGIWVIRDSGGDARRITCSGWSSFAWSADGRRIVYCGTTRDGEPVTYILDLRSNKRRRLAAAPNAFDLDWQHVAAKS